MRVAVRRGHHFDRFGAAPTAQLELARCQVDARREPLDVPLPRRAERFVEVVDVEQQPPLGAREAAEVGRVTVTAGLHVNPGDRRARQVHRHERGRAAKERERRLPHAPVADRQQLRQPATIRLREDVDRIAAIRRCLPLGVRRARNLVAQRLARRPCVRRRSDPVPSGLRDVVGSRHAVPIHVW